MRAEDCWLTESRSKEYSTNLTASMSTSPASHLGAPPKTEHPPRGRNSGTVSQAHPRSTSAFA
ncbi:hypothetical protein N9L68_07620 [bacterium]|nr:hypothetical protein [bacterium]